MNSTDSRGKGAPAGRKPHNIYQRAGSDGAWLGAWLSAMFFLLVLWVGNPSLQLLPSAIMAMMLAVPCMVFVWLRRTYTDCYGMATFSALWMQGILTFGAGSLIATTAAYIYVRWIQPDFNLELVRMLASGLADHPSAEVQQMGIDCRTILDRKLLPAPAVFALFGLWTGMFTGSILSMLLAVAARLARVPLSGKPDDPAR